jgi:serine/threonine protein kinase
VAARTADALEAAFEERESALARIGSIVEGRRLEIPVGLGGMAHVYSARSEEGEWSAIKIARRHIAADARSRERFLAERALVARVTHPACVPITSAGLTVDGAPFLVMELLAGESLENLWRRTPRFTPKRALEIADQLLDFAATCHAAGVVHRDLKPENVFVDPGGQVRVIDFGVAVASDLRDGTRGRAVGTPAFMPPEQARGEGERVDGRADLFSIGASLWSLLSGHRLRAGRGAIEIAARDPARSLSLVAPDVPTEVVQLVDRALASDPRARWPDAEAMRADLLSVLSEVRSVEYDTPSVPALRRAPTVPARPRRALER